MLPSHEALIDRLGTELVPVRRLLPPGLRTVGWLWRWRRSPPYC